MGTETSCLRVLPAGEPGLRRTQDGDLAAWIRRPWLLRSGRSALLVRPSAARDLVAVAQMHRRCSARSLLDRYHRGGCAPAVAALDHAVRRPYGFVVVAPSGDVIAFGALEPDRHHDACCVAVGLLVEDGWQRKGVGSELTSHLAGVAQVAGYRELIGYPATGVAVAQRLMIEIGRTRMVPGARPHLHTQLPDSAPLGLGAVRERLAG